MENLVLQQVIDAVEYVIEPAKREEGYTLTLKNNQYKKYILSKYTPKQDALKFLELEHVNKTTVWCLFGYGFGYLIDHIREAVGEEAVILVVEPNKDLLLEEVVLAKKKYNDVAKDMWVYTNEPTYLFAGADMDALRDFFYSTLPKAEINNLKVLALDYYLEMYAEYFKEVVARLQEDKGNKYTEVATSAGLSDFFIRNIIRNRYAIAESYDIRVHENKYKDIPALVVSAGPSLTKNIQYIKEFKGIIFTGGRTLQTILDQGVNPDFVVSIDPKPITYTTFGEAVHNSFPLITIDKAEDQIIKENKGPQYFISGDRGEVSSMLGVKLPKHIEVGGSVATVCLSAATHMGCNPVIFIGQDLAFTNMQFHASTCNIENQGKLEIKNSKEETLNSKYYKVDGYNGDEVWTNVLMMSYLRWFEMFISLQKHTTYINATEGGARIAGTVQKPFKQIIEEYKDIIKPNIEHTQKLEKDIDVDANIREGLNNLKDLVKKSKRANEISKEIVAEYKLYNGVRKSNLTKLMNELSQIEKKILEPKRGKDIATYLFDSAYTKLQIDEKYKVPLKETLSEEAIRVNSFAEEMYGLLWSSIEKVIQVIEEEFK